MTQTREMRLKDREITDPAEIKSILDDCAICRLGFSEGGVPYVLPMNYGYTYEGGVITLFFHSAGLGRKIDIINANPTVCFEIDSEHRLDPDERPDRSSVKWESLVGSGTLEYVNDFQEKRLMLGNMIRKYRRHNSLYKPNPLTDDRVDGVTMFRLTLDEFKAKREYHL